MVCHRKGSWRCNDEPVAFFTFDDTWLVNLDFHFLELQQWPLCNTAVNIIIGGCHIFVCDLFLIRNEIEVHLDVLAVGHVCHWILLVLLEYNSLWDFIFGIVINNINGLSFIILRPLSSRLLAALCLLCWQSASLCQRRFWVTKWILEDQNRIAGS